MLILSKICFKKPQDSESILEYSTYLNDWKLSSYLKTVKYLPQNRMFSGKKKKDNFKKYTFIQS